MPKVGKTHFPYTKQGEEDAIELGKKTGQQVQHYTTGNAVTTQTPSGCVIVAGYDIEEA